MYLYVPAYLARPGRAACIRREVHRHTQPKMILVRILMVYVGSTSHDIFITYLYLYLSTITYCTYLHVSTLRLSALLVTSDHFSYLLLSSSSSSPPSPSSSSSLSVTSFTLGGEAHIICTYTYLPHTPDSSASTRFPTYPPPSHDLVLQDILCGSSEKRLLLLLLVAAAVINRISFTCGRCRSIPNVDDDSDSGRILLRNPMGQPISESTTLLNANIGFLVSSLSLFLSFHNTYTDLTSPKRRRRLKFQAENASRHYSHPDLSIFTVPATHPCPAPT